MLLSLTDFDFAIAPNALILKCKNKGDAEELIWHYTAVFAKWARQFGKESVKITYPNRHKKFYEVLASMGAEPDDQPSLSDVLMPGIHFDRTQIPLPILRSLLNFAERPNEKWVLIRLTKDLQNQTQIAMTEACRSLVKNASLEQAIGRQRQDYWHLQDLDDLNQSVRQRLEPNNPSSMIEVRWRGVDVPTRSNWREFTYRYWLLEGNGHLFQIGQNIGVKSIAPPAKL